MLLALGERLERRGEAERVRADLEGSIAAVATWARARESVPAVMVFDAKPLFVAGPGGFPDELLKLAGGMNAVKGGGPFPTLDIERLLALDPAVIVDATDAHEGPSRLAELEGWGRLAAVRSGRVRKLASDAAMRPGPRLAEGLHAVARALHGEVPPLETLRLQPPRNEGRSG
jgi:iron complex transport system substrate-binding protein